MQYEAFASVAIPRKLKISLTQDEVDKVLRPCLQKSCELVKKYAKEHHGYKDHPITDSKHGDLTRAITYMITNNIKSKYGLSAKIYINEDESNPNAKTANVEDKYGGYSYAPYVVNGTGIHGGNGYYSIYPRFKKALKFNGRIVHHVNKHPGSKRYAFLDNAIRRTRSDIRKIFEEGLSEAFNKTIKLG